MRAMQIRFLNTTGMNEATWINVLANDHFRIHQHVKDLISPTSNLIEVAVYNNSDQINFHLYAFWTPGIWCARALLLTDQYMFSFNYYRFAAHLWPLVSSRLLSKDEILFQSSSAHILTFGILMLSQVLWNISQKRDVVVKNSFLEEPRKSRRRH